MPYWLDSRPAAKPFLNSLANTSPPPPHPPSDELSTPSHLPLYWYNHGPNMFTRTSIRNVFYFLGLLFFFGGGGGGFLNSDKKVFAGERRVCCCCAGGLVRVHYQSLTYIGSGDLGRHFSDLWLCSISCLHSFCDLTKTVLLKEAEL